MRRYETIFISNPDLSPEERQPLFDKFKALVSGEDTLLVQFDEWGPKRLAYEIKKFTRGYYVLIDYCGNGAIVSELERNMRLDERVLKHMTIVVNQDVDLAAVTAEMTAAKERAAQAAAAAQARAEQESAAAAAAAAPQPEAGPSVTETAEAPSTPAEKEDATDATV